MEIAIKVNAGKFSSAELIGDMAVFWSGRAVGVADKDRARGARGLLPLHHRDPFDRLLWRRHKR